ncbi:MAG TPA: MFS transporter [Fibrobacteria bacterium]|nr:MFS transporter [Fibrobacteria bacterium]
MPPSTGAAAPPVEFSSYQKLVVALLAFLQFTIILDFMILSPLGPILMPALSISTHQFGLVVSAYAFSAGVAGILAAGFADRFDRKKMLLLFYVGFLVGTFLCGIAPTYGFLLFARIVAGLFGGVIGSISFAIVADLFPLAQRGRAMGTIQSAFAASQVLGIPIGLTLATHWGWHGPFLLIVGLGLLVGVVIATKLQPITAHLHHAPSGHNPFAHLWKIGTNRRYLVGFSATMLVATGGFMLQPFGSNFAVHNLGIGLHSLPLMFIATGVVGIFAGPFMGRMADRHGKFRLLVWSTFACIAILVWWTHLGTTPLWLAIVGNCVLFFTISGRIVGSTTLISGVPQLQDRGAYMAISSSMQQFAGAVSSWVAGLIVVEAPGGRILHFDTLGWVVIAAMVFTLVQMRSVDRMVKATAAH